MAAGRLSTKVGGIRIAEIGVVNLQQIPREIRWWANGQMSSWGGVSRPNDIGCSRSISRVTVHAIGFVYDSGSLSPSSRLLIACMSS